MPEVTIVALPEPNDPIHKISSEKKAHLTLLFLGEVTDEELRHILEFVGHVVENSLRPFWLTSDFRGPLGPQDADVLFFDKDQGNLKVPALARDYFLGDDTIRKAYDSVEQYPEWTPHLTLGYPEKPAKPDTHEVLRYASVNFNRIAVWFGDSEGMEFRLKETRSDLAEVGEWSMSDELEDLLEHHGVKGMKWGVRKDKGHEGESATKRQIAKADKKYAKSFSGVNGLIKVQNQVADHMNSRLGALNDKYSGKDVGPGGKHQKPYLKDYEKLFGEAVDKANEAFGTNASGTGRVTIHKKGEGVETYWEATWDEIKHADKAPAGGTIRLKPKFNEKGFITSQTLEVVGEVEQTDIVGDWFEHFGVKGMRWGVRKSEPTSVEVSARPGTKVTAKGGANQPAHDDAIRVAVSKQKAKTSTTDSLSTKELQELVNRMNLEQQYSTLTSKQKTNSLEKGQKQIKTVLGVAKTYNEVSNFLNTDAGKMLKTGLLGVVKSKVGR